MRCDLQSSLRRRLEVQTVCENHDLSMCGWQRLRYKRVLLMYPQLPYVTFFCLHSVCPLSLEDQLLKKAQLMKEVTWSYFEKVPCDSFNYNVYLLIILFAVQTHQNQITSNTTLTCMCTRTVHTVGTYVRIRVGIVYIMVATMQNVVCRKMFANRKFCKLLAKWVGRIFCK